jgi:hypothetical protein
MQARLRAAYDKLFGRVPADVNQRAQQLIDQLIYRNFTNTNALNEKVDEAVDAPELADDRRQALLRLLYVATAKQK